MTDKEILMDVLENEKNMTTNMVYALNEASHEKLYLWIILPYYGSM